MNECTICFDQMNIEKDKLTQCFLCGGCVHTKCFSKWKRKNGANHHKCLYCQVDNNLYKINRSWWKKITDCCLSCA